MEYQDGRRPKARRGPLAGIRVADFCWMGVGSVATRLLADFGAEVIKIEDRTRIDTPRKLPLYKAEAARNFGRGGRRSRIPNKGGLFNNYCRNKLGVTINMRAAEGRELAERLIRAAASSPRTSRPASWSAGASPTIVSARSSPRSSSPA